MTETDEQPSEPAVMAEDRAAALECVYGRREPYELPPEALHWASTGDDARILASDGIARDKLSRRAALFAAHRTRSCASLDADNRRMAGELQAAADREAALTADLAAAKRLIVCERDALDASLAREAALVAEIETLSEAVGAATQVGGGVRARVQGALEESRRRREALAAHKKATVPNG